MQLTEQLNEFNYRKLDFEELFDDRQSNMTLMVKIVKKEVIDIAE